jgi:hypothetical protein
MCEVVLQNAVPKIRDALEWMVQMSAASPFVVIESVSTGRFVQFCTDPSDHQRVLLDLPSRKHNLPSWKLAMALFGDPVLWGTDSANPGCSYQKSFSDLDDATATTMGVLTELLQLPKGELLSITQDLTGDIPSA